MSEIKAEKTTPVPKFFGEMFWDSADQLASDQAMADELRGRQIASVRKTTPLMMLVNTINITVTAVALYSPENVVMLGIWALAGYMIVFFGMMSVRFSFRVKDYARPKRSTNRVVSNVGILALLWGALPLLFLTQSTVSQQIFITCMIGGMMGGGTIAMAVIPRAASVFCLIVATGAAVSFLTILDPVLLACLVMLTTYLISIMRLAADSGRNFVAQNISQIELAQQRSTIGMLLKDFENSSSDWMWHTDKAGRITMPSERFCENLGMSAEELTNLELEKFVSLPQAKESSDLKLKPLRERLKMGIIFRDHMVQIDTPQGARWWNLMGKPIFDNEGVFDGFNGTASDVTEWKYSQDKLNNLARFDQVTNLPNRNSFSEAIDETCKAYNDVARSGVTEDGLPFAIMYIDLDNFRALNDNLGHGSGDMLLREVASRLQGLVGKTDMVARFGGDEYAVLHREGKSEEESKKLANEILRDLARPFNIQGHTVSTGACIGLVMAGARPLSGDDLLRNADLALSRAKGQGGNTLQVFLPGMDKAMRKRRELEIDLRGAVRNNEFVLHYQPLTNTSTGKATTYEALVRWDHPKHGLMLPDGFIPLAEETGIINEIGQWVLQRACMDAATWSSPHRVAVNISARQIMSKLIYKQVIDALAKSEIDPKRLELEVTESILIENPEKTRTLFNELRKLGVSISLDDFGTGYSSLSYLVRFPFDKVKIDKTFIQAAEQSDEDLSIVRSILDLAGNLGIKTAAEGIESDHQMKMVRDEGCDEMQGFLIEEPKPMSEIPELSVDADSKSVA